jgi:hypothetical protein
VPVEGGDDATGWQGQSSDRHHSCCSLWDRLWHLFGENAHVVNSMTVFEFNADAKISHLDVYLQQPG